MTMTAPSPPLDPDVWKLRQYAIRKRHELAVRGIAASPFVPYRFDPQAYVRDKLGWAPWSGSETQPGQIEVLDAYALALRQQHERDAFESGAIDEGDLSCWTPGQVIQNRIRVEAGHTVGKTKLSSGIVNHFFDCFPPAIAYTFAPTFEQIHDLLWKEIKTDRTGKALPGRILDLALDRGPDHFAKGRATSNAGGRGTERVQGQHGKYLLFVFDEAEGIADYVWDAVNSMMSGGVAILLMLANPRTRISRFHKARELPSVKSFRISCIWHPNVVAGRELVPGAVRRDYVDSMIDEHCEQVTVHDADAQTFEVPWRPGQILKPDAEMMFRVLGTAPKSIADNTLVSLGRYEGATKREPLDGDQPHAARMGVDVARYGKDYGTLYIRHNGRAWRAARFHHQDTSEYARVIIAEAKLLAELGVTSLHIRIDGGGGFGGGVIDQLTHSLELAALFFEVAVLEVHFNGVPYAGEAYADLATQMYADAGEALKRIAVLGAPAELEADLCERTYRWMNRAGIAVKRLEPKDDFKKRQGRSPDDGDGFVLAVAPDHVFTASDDQTVVYDDPVEISPY
jgi:hypothetical protein